MHLDRHRTLNLLLLGITVAILTGVGAHSAGLVGAAPLPVQTAFAQRRALTRVVEAFGRVQPRRWVTVRSPRPGQVVALPVEEGMAVDEGDVLARLRADRSERRIAGARARVQRRRALVAQRRADSVRARRRLERQQALREAGVSFDARRQTAHHALLKATAKLEAARAQVAQALARLERAQQARRQLVVRAPTGGTVSGLRVDVGERVRGTSLAPGTRMMRIDRLDDMEIRISVGESSVPVVSRGDSATVQLDAHPGETFSAQVVSVAGSRRGDASGRSLLRRTAAPSPPLFALNAGYPVRLALQCTTSERRRQPAARRHVPPECPTLRTGMSGTVRIRAATVDRALAVPRGALTFRRGDARPPRRDSARDRRARRARPVVFVVQDGVARRRVVEAGLRTETHTEIRSGLQPGAEVVVGPNDTVQRRLSDGDAVEGRGAVLSSGAND